MFPAGLSGINFAFADTTATLYPNGQGTYTAWDNGEAYIDETGTPSCGSSESIHEGTTGNRESVLIDLSSITNGATITSVDITVYDRGDSVSGGTYKTFARLNGSNTDAGSNLTASGGSGDPCSSAKTQTINVPDVIKSGATTLEVGVVKVSGNSNEVRVGAIRAVVTYEDPHTITASDGANGDIDPEGAVVVTHNDSETFSSDPDAGYILADVVVDGFSQGRLNTYTFSSVTADHTIHATFEGGWKAPTDYDNADGISDSNDAYTSNNDYVSIHDDGDDVEYDEFNLGVPSNSVIDGIEVALEGKRTSTRTLLIALSWDNGSTWTSAKEVAFPSNSDTTVLIGGAADTWGRTWTPAEFSNANFQVRVDEGGQSGDVDLDQLQVKVHYTELGSITIQKQTTPNGDPQEFSFTITEGEGSEGFTLSDDGSEVFEGLYAGTYTITEAAVEGYVLTGISCSEGEVNLAEGTVSIDLSLGEDVTCTYTNERLPILTIYKYASPLDTSFDIAVNAPGEEDDSVFVADVAGDGEANSGSTYHYVALGDYTLTETLPEGWGANGTGGNTTVVCYKNGVGSLTESTTVTTTLGYGDVAQCIFNNTPNSIIAGDKFEDLDGKGESTEGEGLSGWNIRLFEWDGGWDLKSSTVTDAGGMYNFGNIQPGKYLLCEQEQSSWYQSVPTTDTVAPQGAVVSDCFNDVTWGSAKGYTIEILETPVATTTIETEEGMEVVAVEPEGDDEFPGQVFDGFRFGNYQRGTIGGFKWHDADANGEQCTEEMADAELCVEEGSTDSNWYISYAGPYSNGGEWTSAGTFSFTNLEPGTYTLSESMKDGWAQTYPYLSTGNQEHTVVVQSGDHKFRNFGNVEDSSISGSKWNDVNADGLDNDEGIAPAVTFNLFKQNGDSWTPVSSQNGTSYSFAGLLPGTYMVTETPADGWLQTYPTSNEGSHIVTVGINGESTDNDFGNTKVTEVTGMKFHDLNRNGSKDEGDTGLSGWTIVATPQVCETIEEEEVCSWSQEGAKTTETDESGYYSFEFINPEYGTWRISEVQQYGWSQTKPTIEGDPIDYEVEVTSESPVTGKDFGNWRWPVVELFKWSDVNSDGVFDESESPVEGFPLGLGRTTVVLPEEEEEAQPFIQTEMIAMELTGANGHVAIPLDPAWFPNGLQDPTDLMGLAAFEGQLDNWQRTFPNFAHGENVQVGFRDGLEARPVQVDSFFDVFYHIEHAQAALQGGQTVNEGKEHGTISPVRPLHFGNHFTAPVTTSGGGGGSGNGGGEQGGNGPIVGLLGGPTGQVLGAATSSLPGSQAPAELPASCAQTLLKDYMRRGRANDPAQVKLLQEFLNGEVQANLPVTGFFGPLTEAAVKAFQKKYADEVLTPWGITEPTGFVYKTTLRKINLIHCGSLNIPMPDLTPFQS